MKKFNYSLSILIIIGTHIHLLGGGGCSGGFTVEAPAPKQPKKQISKSDLSQSRVSKSVSQVSQSKGSDQAKDPQGKIAANAQVVAQRSEQDAKRVASKKPLHFNDVMELEDADEFQKAFQYLDDYYGNGDLEKSQYIKDVEQKCEEARKHLLSLKPEENSILVFDVDDTLLSRFRDMYYRHIKSMQNHGQPNCEKACCTHPQKDEALALAPVKKLWDDVLVHGYKAAIVTNTPHQAIPSRVIKLRKAGYSVPPTTLVMGVPDNVYIALQKSPDDQVAAAVAAMKLAQRQALAAAGCKIAGNVGDFETDHYCECERPHDTNGCPFTGYRVKLPNYLARLESPKNLQPHQIVKD